MNYYKNRKEEMADQHTQSRSDGWVVKRSTQTTTTTSERMKDEMLCQ